MEELELENIEIIDRYLDGSLSAEDRILVKQRLKTDVDFKNTFADVQEAILAVRLAYKDNIKAILRKEQARLKAKPAESAQTKVVTLPKPETQISKPKTQNSKLKTQNLKLKTQNSKLKILRGLLAAASVALLAIIGYWLLPKQATFEFDSKQNTWIDVDRSIESAKQNTQNIINRLGEENGNKLLKGLTFYNAEKFEQAAPILLSVTIQNDTLSLYQANALIKINKGQEAVTILEKIPSTSPLSKEKEWFLAIAYWRAGNLQKAKTLLKDIAKNPESNWRKNAEVLLKEKF